MIETHPRLVVACCVVAAVAFTPPRTWAQEAPDIYTEFSKFCARHFSAEREEELYGMFGKGLQVQPKSVWKHISESSACVAWETNLPAKTHVEYGTDGTYGLRTREPERPFSLHLHYLRNLRANTTYHYRLVSIDERGNIITGENQTFTTRRMAEAVRIPEEVAGPPYVLDRANATYLVDRDLSTDGAAIFIAASGITLDLGGHALTYDQRRDTRDQGACGVRGHMTRGLDLRQITVVNGTVRQGKGDSSTRRLWHTLYNPIFFKNPKELELAGLTVEYAGEQVIAMALIMGAANADIHHNVLRDSGRALFNRHTGMDAIAFGAQDSRLHHNLIKRTRHRGVKASPRNEIHSNEIYIDSYATNSYGIMYYNPKGAEKLDIHHNRIFGTGFHPIGIGSGHGYREVRIHRNYVQMQGTPPQGRWRGGQGGGDPANQLHPVNCIRLQRPRDKIEHHDNVFVSKGRGRGALMRGIWLVPGEDSGKYLVFRNNRIKLVAEDGQAEGYAVSAGGAGDRSRASLVTLKGNTIITNLCHIQFGDNYSHGGRYALSGNRFVRLGDDPRYRTIRLGWRGWKHETFGHTFLDSEFEGGAAHNSVSFDGQQSGRYDFGVAWTLEIKVNPKAMIAIADGTGEAVFTGEAPAKGIVSVPLVQYTRTRRGRRALTPHTVTARSGGKTATRNVTMDRKRSIDMAF